jgi:ATPase family associated with various cellular activities (AAA)
MSTSAARGHLAAEFEGLDHRLAVLLTYEQAGGRDRSEDPLAGLAIRPSDAAVALRRRRSPGVDLGPETACAPAELVSTSPLGQLWRRFDLTDFEAFVTVVTLSVEIDPRYRAVMAFLLDDAAARNPNIALIQRLWAGDGIGTGQYRAAFDPDGRLLGSQLLALGLPDAAAVPRPFRTVHASDWLVDLALGQPRLPASLRPWVSSHDAPGAPVATAAPGTPIIFTGRDQRAVIDAAVSSRRGPVLLAVPDIDAPPVPGALSLLIRQAQADQSGLVIAASVLDAAGGGLAAGQSPARMLARLCSADVHVVDEPGWAPPGWPRREVAAPDAAARAARWTARLTGAGIQPEPDAVAAVAFSHPLPLDDIDAAAARVITGEYSHPPGRIGASVLHRVANEIARPAADQLVRPVDTSATWDDLVLPAPILSRLQDVTHAIAARPRVVQQWGFGARPGSTGLNLLFTGPSGTGKTLAAGVIAGQSGHQLLACDLAQVVDKYLGETEKRLDAVLCRAEAANAVLLFDEADALFGRRADVTDARDRYANLEVAYLLQRIEAHRGITILATNLSHHLDTAFSRRLHDRIDFPQPDRTLRQRIWRRMLPPAAPLAVDVDLAALASAVELSGGEIRAAALSAAYLAAAEDGPIRQRHLIGAVLRELDKAGRRPDRSELPGLRLAVSE